MIFTVFLLLLLFCLLAAWRGWRRLCGSAAVLAVLLLGLVGCGVLPRLLLSQLQAPYALRPALNWAPHNAIVLLTGNSVYVPRVEVEPSRSAYGRIAEAAVLYHACRQAQVSCKLLVSGGDPARMEMPLAMAYGRVLRQLGVPAADLVLESRSNNTWQNAQFSRPLLAALGAPRVWLVSSAWHLRRSMIYFDHFGIGSTPVRADYLRATISAWPSASNFVLTDIALHEYLGMARYYVYNALGRNAPKLPLLVPAKQVQTTAGAVVHPTQAALPSEARSITKR
ncbi:MAG TPA: YdcF family protein [Rhodanobacter sp.]|nr:YdcF family protein [Rhodanobacter sp.]